MIPTGYKFWSLIMTHLSGNIFYKTDHHHPHITFTSYHLSTISVHGVASKVSKEGDGQTDMAKAHYYPTLYAFYTHFTKYLSVIVV